MTSHRTRRLRPISSLGFPGETEEAFERTLQLMEEVKFDNIHSYAYSPRPNTEAAVWHDQIPEEVKSERLQRVQALAQRHAHESSRRYTGRTIEVLVEDPNPRNPTGPSHGENATGATGLLRWEYRRSPR